MAHSATSGLPFARARGVHPEFYTLQCTCLRSHGRIGRFVEAALTCWTPLAFQNAHWGAASPPASIRKPHSVPLHRLAQPPPRPWLTKPLARHAATSSIAPPAMASIRAPLRLVHMCWQVFEDPMLGRRCPTWVALKVGSTTLLAWGRRHPSRVAPGLSCDLRCLLAQQSALGW